MAAYRLDRSPVYLLYRALQSAEEVFRQSTASGLTPRQLAVLMTVAEHEGTNQIELSALTGIDRTTAAEVVRRLARKRFLQRRRSRSDVRAYVLKVTDEGREAMHVAEPVALLVDARVIAALPKGRGEAFVAALQAIVAKMMPRIHKRAGVHRPAVRAVGPDWCDIAPSPCDSYVPAGHKFRNGLRGGKCAGSATRG